MCRQKRSGLRRFYPNRQGQLLGIKRGAIRHNNGVTVGGELIRAGLLALRGPPSTEGFAVVTAAAAVLDAGRGFIVIERIVQHQANPKRF